MANILLFGLPLLCFAGLASGQIVCSTGVNQCLSVDTSQFEYKGNTVSCFDIPDYESNPVEFCIQYQAAQQYCSCACEYWQKCGKDEAPTPPPTEAPRPTAAQPEEPDPVEPDEFPEPPADAVAGACFHSQSSVLTTQGVLTMAQLRDTQPGSLQVMSIDAENKVQWSSVKMWLHADPDQAAKFVEVETEGGNVLSLTTHHLIYTVPCAGKEGDNRQTKLAKDLSANECVLVATRESMVPQKVKSVTQVDKVGIYTFSTETGSIVVDGIAASSYAILPYESITHWFFSKLYDLQQVMPAGLISSQRNDIHPLILALVDSAYSYFH